MLTFARSTWEAAAGALAVAFPDPAQLAGLSDLVGQGRAEVFAVNRGGRTLGFAALGVEVGGVVVYGLAGGGAGLIDAVHEFAAEVARAAGLSHVRAFSARPGLWRRLARRGWREAGRVLRYEVA